MKAITIVGIVFLVVGMVTLMFSGFPIPSKADSDRALIEAALKKDKHIQVPTVFSIAAIGAGITLVILGGRM